MRKIGVSRQALIEFGVLAVLLAVVLLPVVEAGGAFGAGQAWEASPSQAAELSLDLTGSAFQVTWQATISGQESWGGRGTMLESERITGVLRGSAVLRYSPDTSGSSSLPWVASSLQQSYSYEQTYQSSTDYESCYYSRQRTWVVDPARWSGAGGLRTDFSAYREGNAVYTSNPVTKLAARDYTLRFERTDGSQTWDNAKGFHCVTDLESRDSQSAPRMFGLQMYPARLTADSTLSTFTATDQETNDWRPALTVQWTITVRRVGGCKALTEPIDANNQAFLGRQGDIKVTLERDGPASDMVAPQGQASLRASVTCDGLRVKNAELELSITPAEMTGDHLHQSETRPKPPGSLKRSGDTSWTELDEFQPSINMTANDQGAAEFAFRPGRDEVDHSRGINGKYIVKARSTRFPDSRKDLPINVGREDFAPLPLPGQYYVVDRGDFTIHPNGTWGTPASIAGVQNLARDFWALQIAHNEVLTRTGKSAWPLYPLSVNDISLKHGGLFDVVGWYNGAITGRPWSPPHQGHLDGTGVDFNTAGWPQAHRTWLSYALESLGKRYGSWFAPERPRLHLNFRQTAINSTAGIAEAQPDLTVGAFLSAPADRPAVAAGQTVTYTIGIDNLNGGAAAQGVVLTATLPSGLTFLSASPPISRTGGSGQLIWDLGTLEAAALPQTFDVAGLIGSGVSPGEFLTATVEASTSTAEATVENNRADAGIMVQSAGPDLIVSSDLSAVAMTMDQPVTFTVTVANYGNAAASSVVLSMTLPLSVTLSSATPATAAGTNWQLGTLAPDATKLVTVTVGLDSRLAASIPSDPEVQAAASLTYTLGVSSATPDINSENNTERVTRSPVFAGPDPQTWYEVEGAQAGQLSSGSVVTYTVRYANYGNQVAPSSTLSVSLGTGLTLAQAQPAATRNVTSTNFAGGVLGWDLGKLAVSASGCVALRVAVGSASEDGALALSAIQTSGRDIRPENNVFSDRFRIGTAAAPGSGGGTALPARMYLPALMRNAVLSAAARTSVADTGSCQTATQNPMPNTPTGQSPTPTPTPTATPTATPSPTATATPTPSPTPTPTATATATPSPAATPCLQWWCGGGWGADPAN